MSQRLMCTECHTPLEKKEAVHHLDGDPANHKAYNLEIRTGMWCPTCKLYPDMQSTYLQEAVPQSLTAEQLQEMERHANAVNSRMSDTRDVTLLNQWGYPWKQIAVPLRDWPPQVIVWGERVFLWNRMDPRGLCYKQADPYRYESEPEEPEAPSEIPVEAMKRP